MNSSTQWKLSELLAVNGRRVLLIADVTESGLSGFTLPTLGYASHRIEDGVFAFKNGSTLIVWPPERPAHDVPNKGKLTAVVFDDFVVGGIDPFLVHGVDFHVDWIEHGGAPRLRVRASVGIQNTDWRMSSMMLLNYPEQQPQVTLVWLCGQAVGWLKASETGTWLLSPGPRKVLLRDALGRTQELTLNAPTPVVSFNGRMFHLRTEDTKKIVFTEAIHG